MGWWNMCEKWDFKMQRDGFDTLQSILHWYNIDV
jgi:hypothetical protein